MRDHRQRQERELQERLGHGEPMARAARRSSRSRAATSSNGRSLIRPAIGSGSSALTSPPATGDEAALQLDQPVHRAGHVAVVVADHDQIVAVVADRAGERAGQRAEALDEAAPDRPGATVALEHAQLVHALRGSGRRRPSGTAAPG